MGSASGSVKQAENNLKHKDIVGKTAVGLKGIYSSKTLLWNRVDQTESDDLVRSQENSRRYKTG